MATAKSSGRVGTATLFSVAGFAIALVVALVVGLRADDSRTGEDGAEGALLDVEAESVYHFDDLGEMADASDMVVLATVASAERGRLVGDPATGGVISRLLTLEVESMLAGEPAGTILVEEEGWLPDGTPIRVNGVEPSAVGDRGVWFLDEIASGNVSTALVINSQGRFLADDDGTLHGGDQDDPLVRELQQLTLDELVELIVKRT